MPPPPPGYIIDPSDPTRAIPAPQAQPTPQLHFVPFTKAPDVQTPAQQADTQASTAQKQADTAKTERETQNIVIPHVLSDAEVAAIPRLDPTKAWALKSDGTYQDLGATANPNLIKPGDTNAIANNFAMMKTIDNAISTVKQNPKLATGTQSAALAGTPVVDDIANATGLTQPRANLQTQLQGIAGWLRQMGIAQINTAMGGKGGASVARNAPEQQAAQSALAPLGYVDNGKGSVDRSEAQPDAQTLIQGLQQARAIAQRMGARYYNLDPTNTANLSIIDAGAQSPANQQALADIYRTKGTLGGNVRAITNAGGASIPPILIPVDATDDQVRQAAIAAGHNVAPNAMIINGTGTSAAQNGGASSSGVNVTPQSRPENPLFDPSTYGAAYHGFANALTAGLIDPFEAGAATLGNNLGTFLGLNHSTAPEGQIFDKSLADIKARNQADYAAHPAAGWAGTAAGIAPLIMAGAPGAEATPGVLSKALQWIGGDGSLAKGAVRQAAVSAPVGAIEGASNAGTGNRTSGAVEGGATAAAAGAALTPALGLGGKAIGWLGSRILPAGEWNAFTHIAPEADPQAMASEAAAARAAGTQPAAVDTLNNSSLDQVRAKIGGRPGSTAATTLNSEADARTAQAPAAFTAQARAAVGNPPVALPEGTPGAAAPQALRQTLSDLRDQQFADTIAPVRAAKIDVPDDVANLLEGPDMKPVVKGALGFTSDPGERAQIMELSKALSAPAVSEPATVNVGGKQLTPDQVRTLYGNQADAILQAAGAGSKAEQALPQISVGAADALRQSLAKAEGANTPAITAARRGLGSYLEDTVGEYGNAMNTYRQQSRIASPDAGSTFPEAISLGENALSAHPEEMAIAARKIGPLDTPVTFGTGEDAISITPRQAAAEGLVSAIQQQSGKPNGARALGQQMTLPNGVQQARNAVILNPDQAAALQNGIGAEADRLEAANRAAPSSAPGPDDGHTAVGAAAATLYHSPAIQGAKAMSLLQKARISQSQANAIASGLVDPKQTDAIISQIQNAGYNRARAQQLYSMLALQLAAASGRGVTSH